MHRLQVRSKKKIDWAFSLKEKKKKEKKRECCLNPVAFPPPPRPPGWPRVSSGSTKTRSSPHWLPSWVLQRAAPCPAEARLGGRVGVGRKGEGGERVAVLAHIRVGADVHGRPVLSVSCPPFLFLFCLWFNLGLDVVVHLLAERGKEKAQLE